MCMTTENQNEFCVVRKPKKRRRDIARDFLERGGATNGFQVNQRATAWVAGWEEAAYVCMWQKCDECFVFDFAIARCRSRFVLPCVFYRNVLSYKLCILLTHSTLIACGA